MLRLGLVIVILWMVFWISWFAAAAKGTILGLLGASLITLSLWMKARLEEGWLRKELDPGAYDEYRRRVPMLVPFGPR